MAAAGTMGGRERHRILAAVELGARRRPCDLGRDIARIARDLTSARKAWVGVLGADRTLQELATSPGASDALSTGGVLSAEGLLAQVLRSGRPVRLRATRCSSLAIGLPDADQTSSFLAVPMTLDEKVLGALCVSEPEDGRQFEDDDEQALSWLAVAGAMALENRSLRALVEARQPALQGVEEISHALLEGGETDQILRLVVRWARHLLGGALSTLATPEGAGAMVVRVADGHQAELVQGCKFARDGSMAGEVMRRGRPLITDASSERVAQQPIVQVEGMGAALFVPIMVGKRMYGTLAVANATGARSFTTDDLVLVQAFAAEAAVALEYAQIRSDLSRLSVLEDRERIAMELHDGVVQALFVAGLSVQAAEAVADDAEQVRIRLADAVTSIDRVIRDLRGYIFGLQPADLAYLRLERALRELAESMQRCGRISMSVDLEPRAAAALATESSSVIQAAREAMSNAVRHSGADHLCLQLRAVGDQVILEVSDNGRGFDPDAVVGKGLGLANLRARAEAMGGVLDIESTPGGGTTVRLRVAV